MQCHEKSSYQRECKPSPMTSSLDVPICSTTPRAFSPFCFFISFLIFWSLLSSFLLASTAILKVSVSDHFIELLSSLFSYFFVTSLDVSFSFPFSEWRSPLFFYIFLLLFCFYTVRLHRTVRLAFYFRPRVNE